MSPAGSIASPLGGNLGARTCSIFRLDPASSTVPLEPLADIIPAFTPLRVVLDMVDGEQIVHEYSVTEHAIVGFGDITSHVHRRLVRLSITGRLVNGLPLQALPVPPPPPPTGAALGALPVSAASAVRLDLMRFTNLRAIADSKRPVMVVTPRVSMPRALIASLAGNWSPKDGESYMVSLAFTEARIVSPLSSTPVPDGGSMANGNEARTGGGEQATQTVNVETTDSGIDSVPPRLGGGSSAVIPP